MADEHNWEELEASNHTLCANNCLNDQQMSTAKIAVEKRVYQPENQPETSSIPSSSSVSARGEKSVITESVVVFNSVAEKSQPKKRCAWCKRRVGLTGFTCRCGTTFCGAHRYPEKHGCTFDFKTMGKEAIARANPLVKAAKLEKI